MCNITKCKRCCSGNCHKDTAQETDTAQEIKDFLADLIDSIDGDLFYKKELALQLVDLIKDNQEELVEALMFEVYCLETEMISDNCCPECAEELSHTKVHFVDEMWGHKKTFVEYHLTCRHCGFGCFEGIRDF